MAETRAVDDNVHFEGQVTVLASNLRIIDDTDRTKVLKFDASSIPTGTTNTKNLANTSNVYYFNHHAKVGGTAGWVVDNGDDLGLLATCPASQTAATLVVPITGLKIGWTVTSFGLIGQIESAGGAVTLDASLRKLTAADADVADAAVQAMTQISVTADDTIESSNSSTTLSTPEVIAAGETLYLLLTATTAASTDIALQGVTITVTET